MKICTVINVAVVVLLGGSSLCKARLGENATQSEQRYGKATDGKASNSFPPVPSMDEKTYHYQGWIIKAAYLNGIIVAQRYSKKSNYPGGIVLKGDEVRAILASEAMGGEWKPRLSANQIQTHVHPSTWINSNGAVARLTGPPWFSLQVELPQVQAYRDALKDRKEQQRKESLPPF